MWVEACTVRIMASDKAEPGRLRAASATPGRKPPPHIQRNITINLRSTVNSESEVSLN